MEVKRFKRFRSMSLRAAVVAVGFEPVCASAQQTPEPNRYGYGPDMMMDWSGWG